DVIVAVNKRRIRTLDDWQQALSKVERVSLEIKDWRTGRHVFRTVALNGNGGKSDPASGAFEEPNRRYRNTLTPGRTADKEQTKFTLAPRRSGESPRASLEVDCFMGASSESALRKEAEEVVANWRKEGKDVSDLSPMSIGKDRASGWYAALKGGDFQEAAGLVTPAGIVIMVWSYATADDRAECLALLETIEFLVPPGSPIFQPPKEIPSPGYVSDWLGLRWDGQNKNEQCGWATRQFAQWYLGHTLPSVHPAGVGKYWRVETPGYRKVANTGRSLPPAGALLHWDRPVGNGNGHIAVVLWPNPKNGWVRVIDCNWGNDRRGQVHDVSLRDQRILGWLVRE
ncbi:MAG: CHAP domain-containing protein, partial [bacterium]|nr:CHAP domain-containing protein [bacterium]